MSKRLVWLSYGRHRPAGEAEGSRRHRGSIMGQGHALKRSPPKKKRLDGNIERGQQPKKTHQPRIKYPASLQSPSLPLIVPPGIHERPVQVFYILSKNKLWFARTSIVISKFISRFLPLFISCFFLATVYV